MTHAAQPSNGKRAKPPLHQQQSGGKPRDEELVLHSPSAASPPPPDGGWGWVVVFASFMVHVITDGVSYSYGVFQMEFVADFGTTEQAAAWVASFLVGVTYCSGPISSFFVNKFGCRTVTIAGTLLASGCLLSVVWVRSLGMLYLTAGIGTGLGFGLIYLPAIVSVTVYFEKYRSLATGIAVCGSGLGTVIFAPFISYLIDFYGGYKYCMMILAAIVLNCVVLGVMFRPLEAATSSECLPLNELDSPAAAQAAQAAAGQEVATGKNNGGDGGGGIRLALSQPILGKEAQQLQQAQLASQQHADSQTGFRRVSCGSGVMNRSDVFLRSSVHSVRKRSESLTNSEENVRFRLSLRSLPNGPAAAAAASSAYGHQQLRARQLHGDHYPGDLDLDGEPPSSNILRRMLQFSLLRDPLFILFTLSNFCTSIGFNVPYIYLIQQAGTINIDKETASMLLSVIGGANTLGRVVLGYVSDKPWVNRLLVYNCCLTVCGVATVLCPFCPNFATLALYSSVYGFAAGAYVGLTSVCLVDLVGLDRLTNAFGLVLLSQGLASFLGPPIAGALKDVTGVYDSSFYLAGTMIAISGLMLFVVPTLQKRMLRKAEHLHRLHGIAA